MGTLLCLFLNQIGFLLFSCMSYYKVWILTFYQLYGLLIFLPFSMFSFHFVDGFLCWVETFIPLVYFCFCCQVQKIITETYVKELTAMISFRSFMISGLIFKFLIHFCVHFYVWSKVVVQFHFLHMAAQYSITIY